MGKDSTIFIENANIRDLDKAIVLLNLYNNADFAGPIWDSQPTKRVQKLVPGKLGRAVELINGGKTDFDFIDLGGGARPLKISLAGDALSVAQYNRHHGEKRAQKVIIMLHTLKRTGLAPEKRSASGRNSLFYSGLKESVSPEPTNKANCCIIL